jgi:ribonuclease-3
MKHPEISSLEQEIGHKFARRELLDQALTHSSYSSERASSASDNEQLEFLGDAVLGFVTGEELFRRFPEYPEGKLSKLRAHLVSAHHLVRVADRLEIGKYLRLGRGEEKTGGRAKAAILVDALEAVLAALYLDAGLITAREFVLRRIVEPELERMASESHKHSAALSDYKSYLQETLQAEGCRAPEYVLAAQHGPDHRRTFTVDVRIYNRKGDCVLTVRGEGTTKKRAEQMAAHGAMTELESSKATQDKA